MLVETKYLGELEIEKEMIIDFQFGLPGFSDENKFVLLDIPGNEVLQLMQSIQTANVAFFVTNPHQFYSDYAFTLDDSIIEALHIKTEKDIVILSIMTIQEPFEHSTINLKAPIIINANEKCGKQFILNDDHFSLKTKISLPTNQERGE